MEWLNDMALFVEVVKARSFTRAAERLGLSKSTVSQRIGLLEKHLGLPLLNRTTRRIELTEAGTLYFERAERVVAEARLAHQQLGQMLTDAAGLLRVSVTADFAQWFLLPLLPAFCRHHPQIQIDFDLTPRRVDLIGEPVDLAIRIGEQPDSGLFSRVLMRFQGGLFAAPAYLADRAAPETVEALAEHECLRFRAAATGAGDAWVLRHPGAEERRVLVQGRISANNPGMILQLALQGFGIAALPLPLASGLEAEGRLRRVLPAWQTPTTVVHAVTATRMLPAKTRALIDFLRERLGGASPP